METRESERNPGRATIWSDKRGRAIKLILCWIVLCLSVIALIRDVARMDGWRDHGLFYYAPRMFLQGRNAYDWDAMKATWREDGKPLGVDPGTTMSGFVTPPSMALLTLVPSLAPPQFGFRAIDLWNLAALAACLLFLMADAGTRWPMEARLLFAAFTLTLPDVAGVLLLGQSTLVVCACLCAATYFLRRPDQNRLVSSAAGIAIGLALAKFTLSIQFVGLLAYRRKWIGFTAAVITFIAVNAAMSIPGGLTQTVFQFRRVVARENRPGTSYDAISSNQTYMPNTLIHGKRLLYLALGDRRRLIEALNIVLSVVVVGVMAWVMRTQGRLREQHAPCESGQAAALPWHARESAVSEQLLEPLELVLLVAAGLVLFYHRTYDLAALLIVGYALTDEGLRGKDRRTAIWMALVVLFLIITRSATLAYGVGRWLPHGMDIPGLLCWCNCLLLLAIFVLSAIGLNLARRQSAAVD